MADQRIQSTEEMIGAGHATKADTLNRRGDVEHNTDGTHKALGTAAPPTPLANTPYKNTLVKAWGDISYSGGVPTLDAGVNISSIVDAGVGKVTFNFATAMADTNYAVGGVARGGARSFIRTNSEAVGSVVVHVGDTTQEEDTDFSMMIVGNN